MCRLPMHYVCSTEQALKRRASDVCRNSSEGLNFPLCTQRKSFPMSVAEASFKLQWNFQSPKDWAICIETQHVLPKDLQPRTSQRMPKQEHSFGTRWKSNTTSFYKAFLVPAFPFQSCASLHKEKM